MAIQSKAWEIIAKLYFNDLPQEDALYSDIVVKFRRPYAPAFETKTITAADWRNLGSGYYAFAFLASELSTLGTYVWQVLYQGNPASTGSFDVEQEPFLLKPAPPLCVLTGTVLNIGGQPGKSLKLSFRPLSVPSLQGTTLLSADTIYTTTDAAGNFSVVLIRDMKVLVECEPIGLKVTVRIPASATAELSAILPPIPPELN